MNTDPEAQAQLARLLGDESLRFAASDAIRTVVDGGIEELAIALLDEAAASDDVSDRTSAQAYLASRLRFFAGLIDGEQGTRLWQALQAKIDTW